MSTQNLSRPAATEYPSGFGEYVGLPPEGDLLQFMEKQLVEIILLLGGLTEAEAMAIHPPYAWTIKQVVGHMTDAERIFAYRALRIGRNDATPLQPFDEKTYMQFASFNRYPLEELVTEFELMRRSHILLFRHMEPEAWVRAGVVSGHRATARAFPYVAAGHAKHHLDILHKRLGH